MIVNLIAFMVRIVILLSLFFLLTSDLLGPERSCLPNCVQGRPNLKGANSQPLRAGGVYGDTDQDANEQ
jgi:hypothetical protein